MTFLSMSKEGKNQQGTTLLRKKHANKDGLDVSIFPGNSPLYLLDCLFSLFIFLSTKAVFWLKKH